MVWQPANFDGNCNVNASNRTGALTLLCFLIQYFGASNEKILGDIYGEQAVNKTDYDFIIVGAGAAGCVVANRLSEISDWRVLLLEAGDEEPLVAAVPGFYSYLQDSNIDYAYRTNDDKPEKYAQGKVMGGSTTISGMVYARGSKSDFDDWANSGNEGWSWDEVLPYFKKSENIRDPEVLANYSEYHGIGGYLTVDQFPVEDKSTPLFINAFKELGLNQTDYNKGDQLSVSRKQVTSVHGTRLSTNGAFIRPIRGKRSNLIVSPNSRVTRIIINSETKRATGVEYESISENGNVTVQQIFARKEVIISTGFIESPKLLMLSGIGPKDHLEKLNITVIKDLPVGLNLRDHFSVILELISNNSVVTEDEETTKADIVEWINTHEGPQSMVPIVNLQALYQTKFEKTSGAADIQYHVHGLTQADNSLGNFTIVAVLLKSKSKGSVKLNSIDPINHQPDIKLNPLGDLKDLEVLVEGLKFGVRVANTETLKDAGLTLSQVPIPECRNIEIYSDKYMRCLVKNTVKSYIHGVGTCKMGPDTDKNAVVDAKLKVHGISGLRVMDASVMPNIVRGNTGAPTIMIGEKGSDMIKIDYL